MKQSRYAIAFSIFFLSFFLQGVSRAQSNLLDKKMAKAQELIEENKLDDADKYIEKVLVENPTYGDGWDLLVSVRFKEYDESITTASITKQLSGQMTVTTKDKDGKEVPGSDSLVMKLNELMRKIDPSKKAYSKLMYTMRKATYLTREAYASSTYMRILNVDLNVDSNIGKKALRYFKEAEEEFANKNYTKSATLYKRACEEEPGFYKAQMYLGDCYYATGNFVDAIVAFKSAKEKYPFLLEPRKYLMDAYAKTYVFDKALAEAIDATAIYPDYTLMQKLEDAAYMDNKRINIQWTARGVFANKIVDNGEEDDINTYTPDGDTAVTGPWVAYKAALEKIKPFCNSKGIVIKPTTLTRSKYMEVYSWEEMLNSSKDPILDEARRMQKLGYLDCYVMVSCFHYDFYAQYLDFASKNKDRIVEYFKTFTKSR